MTSFARSPSCEGSISNYDSPILVYDFSLFTGKKNPLSVSTETDSNFTFKNLVKS